MAVQIKVNGESRILSAGACVADLLTELNLEPRRLAVERNKVLVSRGQFAVTKLTDGDIVEIVTLVGGG